ncbi:MAG: ribonuclease H-like domain-containing protein [Olpidium bornovanus]|uniref:Ribonuclease H-like domain-containing protein n=1 Tax=Olpidium bornovanus TaxID=278681 RepID=A0A8H7ZXN3_9FUNG|nr:MAG: ribonuclease H-like domain-containing protein [Olpidium bornovanus]
MLQEVPGDSAGDKTGDCAIKSTAFTMDSGATRHLIPNIKWFWDTKPSDKKVWTASKNNKSVTAEGTVEVRTTNANSLLLQDAMHTPTFRMPLFSIPVATYNGLDVLFKADGRAYVTHNGTIVATAIRNDRDRLFYLDASPATNDNDDGAMAAHEERGEYKKWHARLGHLEETNLRLLQQQSHEKIKAAHFNLPTKLCEPCQLGKQTRRPHPPSNANEEDDHTIHVDLTGPYLPSIPGNRYALTYVRPKRLARGYFLPTKAVSGTTSALLEFLPFAGKHGWTKRTHRSDRGGEFMGNKYVKMLRDRGIRIETIIRDTPQQNGVAERINRTLEDRARAVMIASKLPAKL